MDIALITVGSRGDLDPYMALGLGLRSAGHRVRLASNPEHADRVTARGLDFFPFRASLGSLAASAEGRAASDPAVPLAPWLLRLRSVLHRHSEYFRGVIEDCWAACQGADAVVASSIGYGVPHVAEKLGIPYAWGLIYPLTPTRAFPFFLGPLRLTGLAALLSYRVAARVAWGLLGGLIQDWRRRAGLPSIGLRELLAGQWRQPVLYAFSRALVPPPPDWPRHHRVTGYWFLDRDEAWHPPPALADFLAAGSPPLLVGLGSMTAREPRRLAALLREAFARTGRRGVVLAAYGPEDHLWPTAAFYRLDAAPHHRLMPLMAGAIHHGGPGTVAAALRAGLPAFGVPGRIDQPFWAHRIAAAGAGVAPIRADRLTAANLAQAIDGLADERLRCRAQEIGEALCREDGVAVAVEALERCWGRGARSAREARNAQEAAARGL